MKNWIILLLMFCVMFVSCGKNIPEVEITGLDDGSEIYGLINIIVDARDEERMSCVEFFMNDSLYHTSNDTHFVYCWNTLMLPDSSLYRIYAIAYDYDGNVGSSDTISVQVIRNKIPLPVDEDFETYSIGEYPTSGGWFAVEHGSGEADTYIDLAGDQIFKLSGVSQSQRRDALNIIVDGVHRLTYEFSMMTPSNLPGGALVGFYVLIDEQSGGTYNAVNFYADNSQVIVIGEFGHYSTSFTWSFDTWYAVKVDMDFDSLKMDVWIDSVQIVDDIECAGPDKTKMFLLRTNCVEDGVTYFDDIKIYAN